MKDWEKEFDEMFVDDVVGQHDMGNGYTFLEWSKKRPTPDEVKAFIRSLLLEQLEEITERNKDDTLGTYDYDGIAEDVLDTLSTLKLKVSQKK